MKRLPLIMSIIALVGVVILSVLFIIGKQGDNASTLQATKSTPVEGGLKIAYLQTDSVLLNYELSIDLNEDYIDKQKQYANEYSKKRASIEQQAAAFQEKVQRGGFLTEERAMKERDRIMAQQQEVQQLDYELSNKLSEMEQKINGQLIDSIKSYVELFNKTHQYDYIFSNNGNIIVGAQPYNITKDILDGLNKQYFKSKE